MNSYTDLSTSTRIINELLRFLIFSIHERYAQDQREDESRDEINRSSGSNKKEITSIETVVKCYDVVPISRLQTYFIVVKSNGYGVIDRMEAYWSVTKVIPILSFIVSTSESE